MTQLLSLFAGAWLGYRLGQQVMDERWREWLGYDDELEAEPIDLFVEHQRAAAPDQ